MTQFRNSYSHLPFDLTSRNVEMNDASAHGTAIGLRNEATWLTLSGKYETASVLVKQATQWMKEAFERSIGPAEERKKTTRSDTIVDASGDESINIESLKDLPTTDAVRVIYKAPDENSGFYHWHSGQYGLITYATSRELVQNPALILQ